MSILIDQYGNPLSSSKKFNRSADTGGQNRPWLPTRLKDVDKLIPKMDRNTLVGVSRHLVENWAPARAVARQIPMYSVGKAYVPSLETEDQDVKTEVESTIRTQFVKMADIQGRDLATVFYHIAHLVIRDGEAYYLLTERETGFPAIQVIPCHRIGQRSWDSEIIKEGPYTGLEMNDGIIRNGYGVTVAYRVLGETKEDDRDISARSLKQVYDSDYPEGRRGYPAGAHGLNCGRDALQAHEWERLNMLARSSRTMIEWNETGAANNSAATHFDSGCETSCDTDGGLTSKPLEGGTWTHFRAASGSKLQAVLHETPGDVWESFQDRLVWKYCAGVPWPTSFVKGDYGKGGGTAERRDIMQARQTIEDMQGMIDRAAENILGYAYKKLVKMGRLPDSVDWWRWTFSHPAKITIDDGRTSKAQIELWRAGIVSDDDMLTDLGKDPAEYWSDKFNKAADKELAFLAVQKAKGVELDPRYKGMFTPNEMNNEPEEQEEPEAPEPQTKNTNGNTDQD